MQGTAFVDLDMVVFNNEERAQIAEARTVAHMEGKTFKDEKAQEEERRSFFYSPQALYDESLFSLDTLIAGATDAIGMFDTHALRVIFISSVPEYLRKVRTWQLEKAGLLYVYSKYGPATDYTPLHELMLKAEPFTFTKTVRWKPGIICTLSAAWYAPKVIVVDNEQAILDEVVANIVQPVSVFLSLADVVL